MKRIARTSGRRAGLSTLLIACLLVSAVPALAVNLPTDFQAFTVGDTTTFQNPVALAFAPDGRIFVNEQRGRIYILEPIPGATDPRTGYTRLEPPFLEIEDEVLQHYDRGLLGLALDPDFANNGWVYFAYMVETDPGSPNLSEASYTRVERVQASVGNPNIADEATRTVLIGATWDDGIPSMHTSHTTGTLLFGDDGTLLVSHGDGAHFDFTDSGGNDPDDFLPGRVSADQDVGAFRSKYIGSMDGKVLRIDPATGEGIPSNPWFDALNPSSPQSRVWAKGLRNPYRMDIKRGSGSTLVTDGNPGLLAISDVGLTAWEELNLSRGGEDFGWPCYEGPAPQWSYQGETPAHDGCTGDDTGLTYPLQTWPHGAGNASTPFPGLWGFASVGATFQSGPGWPLYYRDLLFFTDYVGRWIQAIRLDSNDQPIELIEFATDTATPVELRFDPYSKDLFAIDFDNGQVLRYAYTGPDGIGTPPAQPTGLVATPGNAEVQLDWDFNSEVDVVGYNVYRSSTATGPWTQINGPLIVGRSFTDAGPLSTGIEYWYQIEAIDAEIPAFTSLRSTSAVAILTAKVWDWYAPHPGPTMTFTASPAPFPREITLPNPATSPNYDIWTGSDRAPQLRKTGLPDQDFTLETTIRLVDFINGTSFFTGIIVGFASADDALVFGPYNGTQLKLERSGVPGLGNATNDSLTVDLRVVRTGNDFSFEYRNQPGQAWQVAANYNTPDVPTWTGVVAKTWAQNIDLTIEVQRLGLNELDPIAQTSASTLTGPAPLNVDFTSTSFDPDGDLLLHAWDFGDGNTSILRDPSHSFAAPGSYPVLLTVTDAAGYTDTDTLNVFVEGNQPPTAQIDAPFDGMEFIDPALPIALSGSSADPDNLPGELTFSWRIDLHSGTTDSLGYHLPPDGPTSSFTPTLGDSGEGIVWDVVLTVTDPGGLSAADTVQVIDASLPPVALLDLRASLADGLTTPTVPGAASPWANLGSTGAAADATLQSFSGTGWAGTGNPGDPWRLEFDGIDDIATVPAGTLPGLDQAASLEAWVRIPADTQSRSYLFEWLESTASPFPGMSLAVENGQLRIYLGSWIDLAPVYASRWTRIVVVKQPGSWLVEVDGTTVGSGTTANLGAQNTELVIGAGTFAGVGQYSEYANFAVAELRVWDRALSPANLTVLGQIDGTPWANAPTITGLTPDTVDNNAVANLTVSGRDFEPGASLSLIRAGVDTLDLAGVTFVSEAELQVSQDFTGLAVGPRDLRVVHPDGQEDLLPAALTIQEPSSVFVELLARRYDGSSPPAVPSAAGPWINTVGPQTFTLNGFDGTASSGWAGDGGINGPWHLHADGIDDELVLPGGSLDSLTTATEFTLEFWARFDAGDSTGTLIGWTGGGSSFALSLTPSGLRVDRNGDAKVFSDVPRDRWTHVVLSQDATMITLWINGSFSGADGTAPVVPQDGPLTIGSGLAADLAIFRMANTSYTGIEVVASMNADAPLFAPATAALVRLVPSATAVADGDSLNIDLHYDDLGHAFGLRGGSIAVQYDPNLLNLVSVSEGDLLPGAGTSFFASDTGTPGTVSIDMSLLGQGSGAMGAGNLATVRFASAVSGADTTATLTFSVGQLIDAADPPLAIPSFNPEPLAIQLQTNPVTAAPPRGARLAHLYPAEPNPFNPRTRLHFDLARSGLARLSVYDLSGRLVRTLVNRELPAGSHDFLWNGIDRSGRSVASGVYLFELRALGGERQVRKMTLLK